MIRKSTVVFNKNLPNVKDASVIASRIDGTDEDDNVKNNSVKDDNIFIRSEIVNKTVVKFSHKETKLVLVVSV